MKLLKSLWYILAVCRARGQYERAVQSRNGFEAITARAREINNMRQYEVLNGASFPVDFDG